MMNEHEIEQTLIWLSKENVLFPGYIFSKEQQGLKLLGQGGFSFVYEMYPTSSETRKYALKVSGFDKNYSQRYAESVTLARLLAQESLYVLKNLEYCEIGIKYDETIHVNQAVLITSAACKELVETQGFDMLLQCTLMEALQPVLIEDKYHNVSLYDNSLKSEKNILEFALQIGQAIKTAHDHYVLHRDIKLENIFWDSALQIYKLGDFGNAKYTGGAGAETIVYTAGYGAPEVEGKAYELYTRTADIYSFGVTLYILLNDLSFPGSETYVSQPNIQYLPGFIFPAPRKASPQVTAIVQKMCSFNAADRYQTMDEVLVALADAANQQGVASAETFLETCLATETSDQETNTSDVSRNVIHAKPTRSQRIREAQILRAGARVIDIVFCFTATFFLIWIIKGLSYNDVFLCGPEFFILASGLIALGCMQHIKVFVIPVSSIVLAGVAYIYVLFGQNISLVLAVAATILFLPSLTIATGFAMLISAVLTITHVQTFFDLTATYDLAWISIVIFFVILRWYLFLCGGAQKISLRRLNVYIIAYNIASGAMVVAGIIIKLIQQFDAFTPTAVVTKLHLIPVGLVLVTYLIIESIITTKLEA